MDYFHSIQDFEPKQGDLLISEPYLPDPNFERTVILICSHDENGSLGYVLNQESKVVLKDLIDDISAFNEKLFIGGPVQQDTLHFVHRSKDIDLEGQLVKQGIYWGGSYDRLLEMIKMGQVDKNDFKFFIGYSGWAAGQLRNELESKSWFVYKDTNPELIFETPAVELWKKVLESLGGKFKMMSKYPIDPRMN